MLAIVHILLKKGSGPFAAPLPVAAVKELPAVGSLAVLLLSMTKCTGNNAKDGVGQGFALKRTPRQFSNGFFFQLDCPASIFMLLADFAFERQQGFRPYQFKRFF
jgi:hypothetical protein